VIVCIEGGDATGKATQSKILAARLNAKLFSFPDYMTTAGQAILSNLKRSWYVIGDYGPTSLLREEKGTNALALQSLMLMNRLEKGAELAEAARQGHVVLDRYDVSSVVYGSIDGLPVDWITRVNAQLQVKPDVYILLDAPVEESFKRRPERRDRYETDREFLEKVRRAYVKLFEHEIEGQPTHVDAFSPDIHWRRWNIVDAVGTIDEVAERVRACLPERLFR
jgi:dTMP kinase